MIRLELLFEDESTENALRILVPKIVGEEKAKAVKYRSFRGKYTLLKELPAFLKGYTKRIRQGERLRVLVLVDRDVEDCEVLKQKLESIALQSGLITRSIATTNTPFQILNRIAIEALEAWFLGDPEAIRQAYPHAKEKVSQHIKRLPNPDAVMDAWETLEKILKDSGYRRDDLRKTQVAQRIAHHMQPDRNRSQSFRVFREGLSACLI